VKTNVFTRQKKNNSNKKLLVHCVFGNPLKGKQEIAPPKKNVDADHCMVFGGYTIYLRYFSGDTATWLFMELKLHVDGARLAGGELRDVPTNYRRNNARH